MASDEQVATDLKAALNAQLQPRAEALDHDEHDGVASLHVQFGLASRPVDTERAGRESLDAYRITTRVVADTVSNARELQRRVNRALRGQQISIEGRRTSPIKRGTQDEPTPDEGLYSALTVWTFTH